MAREVRPILWPLTTVRAFGDLHATQAREMA
jgi:hypothetical protein